MSASNSEATISNASDATWRFCVLTPQGRGAIATIAVHGCGAKEALGKRFQPLGGGTLAEYALDRAVYGRFRSGAAADEDVVVGILGGEELEIHCHGGEAAARAICEALDSEGGQELAPETYASAVASDAIEAEAWLALANVRTERGAAILLDQYRGALRTDLERIERLLADGSVAEARLGVETLLRRGRVGLHLTQPWKVVLAGEPNAGKSSLMNAVLGYERSIVWPEPGTTRDVLVATTAMDGWWVELSDVAGLRSAENALEAAGVERAEQQIAAANLVVLVADVTAPWNAELYRTICEGTRRAGGGDALRVIVAHSKCDLAESHSEERPRGVVTSAVQGLGLAELCKAIVAALVTEPLMSGMAVPFTVEQVRCLETVARELERGNVAEVVSELVDLRSRARLSHPT